MIRNGNCLYILYVVDDDDDDNYNNDRDAKVKKEKNDRTRHKTVCTTIKTQTVLWLANNTKQIKKKKEKKSENWKRSRENFEQ